MFGEWQPIETAPQDGTPVIVGWLGTARISIGFYGPKYSMHGVNYGDAWGYGYNWGDSFDPMPTHYMPRPDPPKENV